MHVLVAFDGSDPAREALEYALTHRPDASLTVLYVIDPYEVGEFGSNTVFEVKRQAAKALLEEARELAADHGRPVATDHVVGKPAREIASYAGAEDVDHVVVGSHGRTGGSRLLLGSVAETTVRRSPVPVTVVR